MPMDDLTQWLSEQLDEDQRDAEARRGVFPQPGVDDDGTVWLHIRPGGNAVLVRLRDPVAGYDDLAKLKDWTDTDRGWTQERALREIHAKRQALAHYEQIQQHTRQGDEAYVLAEGAVAKQIQYMATGYDQRPGYREEWRS